MISFKSIKKKIILAVAFVVFILIILFVSLYVQNRYRNLDAEYPPEDSVTKTASEPAQNEVKEERTQKTFKNLKVQYYESLTQGEYQNVTVHGKPNTEYSIKIVGDNKTVDERELKPKTSGEKGLVDWAWELGKSYTPGVYAITISDGNNSVSISFIINETSSLTD